MRKGDYCYQRWSYLWLLFMGPAAYFLLRRVKELNIFSGLASNVHLYVYKYICLSFSN